jgi:hypothetical protein
MKQKIEIVIAGLTVIFFFAFFLACTAPFDIQTDDSPPVIVIYGVLTDEVKYQEVKISRSSPYFDDQPNVGISGANVTVRSSDETVYLFSENDSIPGLYHSQLRFGVRPGSAYALTVEVDFDKDGIPDRYEASTEISPVPVIDSLTIEPVEIFGHKNHLLYIHAQDPPEKDFYLFNIFYNDSLITEKITDLLVSDDELINNQYIEADIYLFDDISEWEKDTEERRKRSVYLKSGDQVTVELGLISEGYFDFINQCQQGKNGENPMFGGPASNIITNISNGGAGYFTGYCTSKGRIVFDPLK